MLLAYHFLSVLEHTFQESTNCKKVIWSTIKNKL